MGKIDLSELKKQVKANPKDADLLHTYGVALVQAHGAVDDGIRQLQLALKEKPDSPEIINDLGLAFFAKSSFDEAVKTYERGLKTSPDHLNLLINMANGLRFANRHADAVPYYEKALKKAPTDANAQLNYANVLADLKRVDEASALYERVLTEQPANGLALLKYGELLAGSDRVAKAMPLLERAVKATPSARCYAALAAAQKKSGDVESAIATYGKACAADTSNADVRVALGQLQYESGFLDDAVKTLEEAVALEPNAVTHNSLGIAYQAQQHHQDAIGHFTKAVELDGRLCAALANLGHVLDDMGLYQEAVAHFKRAVDIDPQAAWYKKLGISLVHLEKYAEAIEEFLTGLAIDAKDPTIHYNMAAAYGKQGKLNEAMLHAAISLELDAAFEPGQQMTKMLRPHTKPDVVQQLRAKYDGEIQLRMAKVQQALKRTDEERKKRDERDSERRRAKAVDQEAKMDAERRQREAEAQAKADAAARKKAKEQEKAAAKEQAKAAEKAAKQAELERKRKELEEQREAERLRREAEAKARAEAEAKAAAEREAARKAAEAAAAAERAAAEKARREAEAAAAEAKRLQAEAEAKARAAADAAEAERLRAEAAALAEKARRDAAERAAAAEAAEKKRREREEERQRAEALARRKAEQEAAEAKALAEMEALMAAEMDAAAEEELARAVQEAADAAAPAAAGAAVAAADEPDVDADADADADGDGDDDADVDADDKKLTLSSKKHKKKHSSSSSTSTSGSGAKRKKDRSRTKEKSADTSPTKPASSPLAESSSTATTSSKDSGKAGDSVLLAVPRETATLWQQKESVDELLKEYKSTRQGLNQQQRRERFNKFGENRCVAPYPAKLVEKTTCRVLQEGEWLTVHPRTLVPGDVVLLQQNTWLPADVRVLTSLQLCVRRPGEHRTIHLVVDAATPACVSLQGDVVQSGWGTGLVLRGGATPPAALQEAAERVAKCDDNLRHAEKVDYDTYTTALVDELHNVNGIDLLSRGALASLERCSMVVAQHSAFVMDKIDFKSVFWDGDFLQAPLIKWIAARERLAALQGTPRGGGGDTPKTPTGGHGDDDGGALDAAELFATGRYAAAIKKLKAEHESAKLFFNIGVVQMRAEQYDEALASFDASLNKDKYLAIAYHERAACRLRLDGDDNEDHVAALKDAEKALELLRTHAFVDYGQMSLNYRLARASVLANVAVCRSLGSDHVGALAASAEARKGLDDVASGERASVAACLDAVDKAAASSEDVEDAGELAVAMESAVLFDTATRTDVNAGPRPSAGSSRLHSRGVFEALRRLAVLCSTGERRKPKAPRKPDDAASAAAAADDPAEKARRLEAELKEAKMKMMMLVGNMGKSQAKLKSEPNNAALQAEVGKSMKELALIKTRITELETLTSGGEKRVGGSVLISLTKARKEFEADPLRGVAMYKRATEWELQNQLTFRNEWETEVMATLDATAPKLAQFYDWFSPGARDDTPGDVISHKSLWLEVDSGQWYLCWRANLEVVLQLSSHQLTGEQATTVELTDAKRRALRRQFLHEPNAIAYAQKAVDVDFDPSTADAAQMRRFMEDNLQGSVFVGCVVLKDTLQPNVKALVRRLITIGIKVVLLTNRSKLAAEVSAHNLDLLDYTPESALDETDESGKPFGLEDSAAAEVQRSGSSVALARIKGSKIWRKASNTIKGEVDPNNLPVRSATLQAARALTDHAWIKGADQIVVYGAASDCAPLIQLANREKQSVCFVGDQDCVMMLEAADVGCVYARAASALTRRSDVYCGNNLFEDVVFALEASKAMKIKLDKGGRLVAAKPDGKPEQRPEESTGKVANFFLDVTFQ